PSLAEDRGYGLVVILAQRLGEGIDRFFGRREGLQLGLCRCGEDQAEQESQREGAASQDIAHRRPPPWKPPPPPARAPPPPPRAPPPPKLPCDWKLGCDCARLICWWPRAASRLICWPRLTPFKAPGRWLSARKFAAWPPPGRAPPAPMLGRCPGPAPAP